MYVHICIYRETYIYIERERDRERERERDSPRTRGRCRPPCCRWLGRTSPPRRSNNNDYYYYVYIYIYISNYDIVTSNINNSNTKITTIIPPLTIKYCRIYSRPKMLNFSATLQVHVCCCIWVSIWVAEGSPGSVWEFKFGVYMFGRASWDAVLGFFMTICMWRLVCKTVQRIAATKLTRNMRKSSWLYLIVRGCSIIIVVLV